MSRRRKSLALQRIEYAFYRAVAWCARRLSDEGVLRWGDRFGNIARRILRSRDRLAMRNLRETFHDKSDGELRVTLEACWRHFGRQALFSIRMQDMSLDQIAARCPLIHAHLLEEAIARGKGVILISAHYGAWEMMQALSENAVLVVLPDQAVLPREGVLVSFLGRPAWTTPIPAKMAVRRGSTIVFAFCIPTGS